MNKQLIPVCIFFVILFLSVGCQKDDNANNSTTSPSIERPKTLFYFRGSINGTYKDWTVTDYHSTSNNGWGSSRYYFNAGSMAGSLGDGCESNNCMSLTEDAVIAEWNGPGYTRNYIATGFTIASNTGNRSDIIRHFAPGEKTFGKPRKTASDPVKDGAYVYYIDENNKAWCSHWGSGDQPNSVFTSVELLPQPDTRIGCLHLWKVRFSCTVYDQDGASLQLRDCEIFSPVLVKK